MQPAVALTENHLVLGRYRPLRPLGSGGGGSVWLARDEHADREVALKVVEREGKPGARAEREVDAATRLRHPRCLRASRWRATTGTSTSPTPTSRVARFATPCEVARSTTGARSRRAQVLEALAHAHSKGVVHRDVKPANVMLEDGDEVSVRLLDFGLAQLEHADTLTAVGDVPGTLAYIAPSGSPGRRRPAPRTSGPLASSSGRRSPDATRSGPYRRSRQRRVEQGAQPLAELRPDLPRELCRAVDRMLSVDPRKRPSAKQALGLLRAAEEDRTERRRATTSPTVLRERASRRARGLVRGGNGVPLPFFPSGGPSSSEPPPRWSPS